MSNWSATKREKEKERVRVATTSMRGEGLEKPSPFGSRREKHPPPKKKKAKRALRGKTFDEVTWRPNKRVSVVWLIT